MKKINDQQEADGRAAVGLIEAAGQVQQQAASSADPNVGQNVSTTA